MKGAAWLSGKMNRNKAETYIPALAKTSLDMPPLWGRLIALTPADADFLSHFELPAGRMLTLTFELGGAEFPDVRALIKTALRDGDGYYNYALVFVDPAQSAMLRTALIEAGTK